MARARISRSGELLGRYYISSSSIEVTSFRACYSSGCYSGICDWLSGQFVSQGIDEEEIFLRSTRWIKGLVFSVISKRGIKALSDDLNRSKKTIFAQAYCASYETAFEIMIKMLRE